MPRDDIPRYAIFYGDGSVVEGGGEDDEWVEVRLRIPKTWRDAPPDNVQAVICENPYSSRYVWRGTDFYYWVPDGEASCADSIGEFMRGYLPLIKFGLCLPEADYSDLVAKLKQYTGIPIDGPRQEKPDANLD